MNDKIMRLPLRVRNFRRTSTNACKFRVPAGIPLETIEPLEGACTMYRLRRLLMKALYVLDIYDRLTIVYG